ncbi:site-specific integrase [Methylobacterium sp. J-030]|uniref:tyrosine-type recombinase/integrase n=1 Tax=Methylobacterium sp. J-030 TaxID=2836627 RepID=UPI001FBB38C4|nr:tyrosine-type recombinase/integrase [Methylobacterium sp. J-030]MCJ2068779.1 site-specific integrase [Methylobacterium sp. J-030]
MTTATTRRDSSLKQFQKRVPADILAQARGRSFLITLPAFGPTPEDVVEVTIRPAISFSLRVRDPAASKMRVGAAGAQLERIFASLRHGPVELTHRQTVALSGEVYRLVVGRFEMDPGEPGDWEAWKAFHWAAMEGRVPNPPAISWQAIMDERNAALGAFGVASGPVLLDIIEDLPIGDSARSLEIRFGLLASWVLTRHGLEVAPRSRLLLLQQVAEAALDAGWAMKRAAQGDYTLDTKAMRFPPIESGKSQAGVTVTELFERWRKENKPAASTLSTWRGIVADFENHIKHADAARVTEHDVVGWKDARVAAGRAAKTINDSDLACLRVLFRFAVTNKLIAQNPVEGIKVKVKRQAGKGKLPYTNDEVARLLAYAEKETLPHLRYVPILLATTGSRVQDIVQLWSEGVTVEEGVPVLRITPAPDGASLKTVGSERVIPMHPAVLASGFIEFARSRNGPLFYGSRPRRKIREDGEGKHPSKGTSNRVSEWVRKQPGFQDKRKDPNHAMRHWLKSAAAKAGVLDSVANHIQGHTDSSVAGRYRHHDDLKSLADALAKIPIPTMGCRDDNGTMPSERPDAATLQGRPASPLSHKRR